MSFAQERLWLVDQAAPGSAVYNVPLLTRWHEPVDPDALAAALTAVVARHEVLRTTYHLRGERPVQVVGAPVPVAVEVRAAGESGESIDAEITARARLPFDLAAGPPLRCTVWRGAPGGDVMLLVVHHIAVDGWSLGPLYADLAEAYLAGALPELPLQYSDFASWDRASFDESRQRRLVARATELLDTEPLTLSGARPTQPSDDRPGTQVSFDLPPGVDELARALRVTPFVVLHAAFQAVLHRWSGRERFVVGAVTANRPHPEVEGLIGFFVNTVPMRCSVSPEWTFRELCRRTRAEAYGSLTHQWLPFDRLTAELAAAGGNHRPVEVCFALQNMPAPHPETRWSPPVVLPTGTAKFDLLLIVEETGGRLTGTVEYDTDRYPDEVCHGVVEDYRDLLARATADPDLPQHRLFGAPLPAGRHPVAPTPATRPATAPDTELRMATELFADALATLRGQRADIEATSNFFALGGHSLLAVTMLARAGVSPRDFFADPTVGGLARLLATADPTTHQSEPAAPDRVAATSTQQRFWFLDRIPALRAAYLMPTVLELTGPVDRTALLAAVDHVLARHPALRSRFELDRKQRTIYYRTGGPPATCTATDASTWDATRLRDHVADRCWSGFDLSTDAPVRADIVTVATDRTLVILVPHHIVADGWSRHILLDEIAATYRGAAPHTTPVHPGTPRRDHDATRTEDLVAQLSGAPVDITLPHDRERPPTQTTLAASTSFVLNQDLTARLRAIAAEHECTTFLLTGALLAATLAKTGPQRDFLFAFPWAGRDARGSLDTVAMLVNTLVLRVDLRGAHTWRELLARTRESGAIAYRNANASFDELVATLHPDRDLTRPPLTPVFLSAAAGPDAAPAFAADVRACHLPLHPLHVKYEIELTATDHPDHLEFGFAYATALFDPGTVTALATDLHAAAVALAANPEAHPLTQARETAPT